MPTMAVSRRIRSNLFKGLRSDSKRPVARPTRPCDGAVCKGGKYDISDPGAEAQGSRSAPSMAFEPSCA
jgi:hypothetical protein